MNKGWLVAFSGMGFNLTMGVVYAWSVFGKKLTDTVANGGLGWTNVQMSMPYTISIVIWALCMIPGGRLQDKLGPRIVATLGALFLGAGMIVTGFSSPESMMPAIIGFGGLCGIGIGLGYAAATPAAVKWFPASMKGQVTGVVVAGMGIASVFIAPLSEYLIGAYGITKSFTILGVVFAVLAVALAQCLRNPPEGYVPQGGAKVEQAQTQAKPSQAVDHNWKYMVSTPLFYVLWIQFVFATSAGLMIIGHMSKIVSAQSMGAIQAGFLFVALLSAFNATGRVVSGFLSDKLGANRTLLLVCSIQIAIMLVFNQLSSFAGFFMGAAIVGFNYGACMPLFPTLTMAFWGTKNLGMNYGILYTAWGAAGVVGPVLAGAIADATGSYSMAYVAAAGLLAVAVALCLVREFMDAKLSVPFTKA